MVSRAICNMLITFEAMPCSLLPFKSHHVRLPSLRLCFPVNLLLVASMSRPVAGVRNKTLILTLPGSPKGAKENLEAVLKLLPHACMQIAGEDSRVLHDGGVKKLEKDAGV